MKLSASGPTIDEGNLGAILGANHDDPFSVLGMHQQDDRLVVRALRPGVKSLEVFDVDDPKRTWSAFCVHSEGFFEASLDGAQERFRYGLKFTGHDGRRWSERDTYSFGPMLGPLDLHLFAEGNHWQLYEKLGAHLAEVDGAAGCSFHVWAPNARRVSVVGDFNGWDGRAHPMRKLLGCGVWEIFIPGITEGAHYKFEVKAHHGGVVLKS